jgi:hypothetical protein
MCKTVSASVITVLRRFDCSKSENNWMYEYLTQNCFTLYIRQSWGVNCDWECSVYFTHNSAVSYWWHLQHTVYSCCWLLFLLYWLLLSFSLSLPSWPSLPGYTLIELVACVYTLWADVHYLWSLDMCLFELIVHISCFWWYMKLQI